MSDELLSGKSAYPFEMINRLPEFKATSLIILANFSRSDTGLLPIQ